MAHRPAVPLPGWWAAVVLALLLGALCGVILALMSLLVGNEVIPMGGKPNPGTRKDRRLKGNKPTRKPKKG